MMSISRYGVSREQSERPFTFGLTKHSYKSVYYELKLKLVHKGPGPNPTVLATGLTISSHNRYTMYLMHK